MDKILLFFEAIGYILVCPILFLLGIIGVVIIASIPFVLIGQFLEYMLQKPSEEYRGLPKLEFKKFYDFRSLSPDTWCIEEDYVFKVTPEEVLKFTFEGKEYRKYMKFYKKYRNNLEFEQNKIEQRNKHQYDNKQTIKLLEAVQEEINAIKAQSVKEIEDSTKTMMKIQNKIVGG